MPASADTECAALSEPPAVDVCVVGGGLGGLALAVALQQLGLQYVICEAADELRTGQTKAVANLALWMHQACGVAEALLHFLQCMPGHGLSDMTYVVSVLLEGAFCAM